MKLEFQLFHRYIFRNGKIGDWVYDAKTQSKMMLNIMIDVDRQSAERKGRKVEHKLMVREISDWKSADLNEILKSDNKEVGNA